MKAFQSITEWGNVATTKQINEILYGQHVPKLLENIQATLENAHMEMKKQHFDHGYIEALDVAYVKVQELEADNEDTKEDGEEEEDIGKEEMKGKGKKVVDVYDEDEITPIDTFMMKKEIVEALVQYNGKE